MSARTAARTAARTTVASALLLAAAAAAPASAATQLLSNAGFETGTLSGWSCTGADKCETTASYRRSGSWGVFGFDNYGHGTLSQTIATEIGATYEFSVWARAYMTHPGNILRLSAAGETATAATTTAYARTGLSFVADAAFTTVAALFETDRGTGTWQMDDFALVKVADARSAVSDVPVPAAAPLLAAGLAGIAALRRRA